MARNSPSSSFQGKFAKYLGIGLLGCLSGGLCYLLDIGAGLGSITALIGVAGIYKALISSTRKVLLKNGELSIIKGAIPPQKLIILSQLDEITISRHKHQKGISIIQPDLCSPQKLNAHHYIHFYAKGQEKPFYRISQNSLGKKDFYALLKALQQDYLAHGGTLLQRAAFALCQTQSYLREDKLLKNEFAQNLNEAYPVAYKPFKSKATKEIVQQLQQDEEILYHYIQQGNIVIYFKANHYQDGIHQGDETLKTVQNLVAVNMENLQLVQNRLAAHQSIIEQLQQSINRIRRTPSLHKISAQLEELQAKNMDKEYNSEDLALEAEVIEQLQMLSKQLLQSEQLDQSQELREYVEMLPPTNRPPN